MANMLLDEVDYKVESTGLGTWKRYVYPTGIRYHEFKSHAALAGVPLIHYTFGICPETGHRRVARGIIAMGRFATGIVAIGQVSMGLIAIGQLAIGVLFGFGQATTGLAAIGQLAIGAYLGIGQLVVGEVAIGQIAYGKTVLAQVGFGQDVWSMSRSDPAAKEFFSTLLQRILPW